MTTNYYQAPHVLHSGLGAALMIVGATAAILSIPQDFSESGALRLSGLILTTALLAPTLPALRNDVRSLLRGENILLGALVYWTLLDILQGAYSLPVSREAVVAEFLLLTITGLGFWLGATAFRPMAPSFLMNEALRPWSPAAIFRALCLAFLLGVWDFLYRSEFDLDRIAQSLVLNRWDTPWQREALGDWSAFSFHLQYFGYLVPALTVLLALRVGLRNPATWLGAIMSVIILGFHMQGGGRRIVGAMILAGLFCWLVYVRRLNFKRLLLVTIAVGSLAAVMQLMLIYRNVGLGDSGAELGSYDYLHVDDNFLRIAQMLEFVPDVHPYVGFQFIAFALMRPIPRVLWPDKPVDGGFDLAELLGIPGTTFAITSAGEFFVSYGYIATFIGGLVYGRASTMVNALFRHNLATVNPVFPALLLVWLFVGVRSILEIMLMGYVLLAVIALSKAIAFFDSLRGGVSKPSKHI